MKDALGVSVHGNPTIADSVQSNGKSTEIYSVKLDDLLLEHRYHGKEYAKNSLGGSNGNRVSFITRILPPSVYSIISNATTNSFTITFVVSADGGSPLIERDIYYDSAFNTSQFGKKYYPLIPNIRSH